MNTEITLKGIPVLRSGYSDSGFVSARMVLAINHNSSNKTINVKYMGCHIGYISHIHCGDLPDGGVELRGDISFPISNLIAHREILNNKDVYPTCIIKTASGANEARLSEVILFTKEKFQGQQPLDLSELRNLINSATKSEAPAELFRKQYNLADSGYIGSITTNKENKIYLNETDTLEAKDGYLVIKTNETTEAVKIEGIGIITSTKNKKGTNDICISTTSCGVEIRNSDIGTSGILKFIERYKESQFAELKI
ncbi:hypothetical protein GEM17_08555 [Salmonella enterica]|nr:hypothetical protein [Salmonella enterica]